MVVHKEVQLEGCNFLRQHIVFSLLSGFERTFLSMIKKVTNGTEIKTNKNGTELTFRPGIIQGGELEIDCDVQRCVSYFLEPLILIAPFCKKPLDVHFTGVTNSINELSVDAIRATWLPVFSRFVLADQNAELKINARGFKPDGGGSVTFTSPIKRNLRAVQCVGPGKVCKVRGLAYVCKVTPSIASRMIDGAKKMLHGYIADVYITIDQRKGPHGGLSPGFGIFLTAETTEGVFYHGEAMSRPKGLNEEQIVPEEVGEQAARRLLDEIHRGGCTDSSSQSLAASFMTLCDKDVSKFLFGPLTICSVRTLRNLRLFFEQMFKLEEWWKVKAEVAGKSLRLRMGENSAEYATNASSFAAALRAFAFGQNYQATGQGGDVKTFKIEDAVSSMEVWEYDELPDTRKKSLQNALVALQIANDLAT
uniref:RNA 3'-terminal phosphate cyclase-like protein n=1 Tax=Globodera rostochiensis TaxID=31243 RepID=A0A914GYI1_GLORO